MVLVGDATELASRQTGRQFWRGVGVSTRTRTA